MPGAWVLTVNWIKTNLTSFSLIFYPQLAILAIHDRHYVSRTGVGVDLSVLLQDLRPQRVANLTSS